MGEGEGDRMMGFADFARDLGLIVRHVEPDGRVHRVPTVTKPRKKNGAYRLFEDWGWAQCWDTMKDPAIWRADRPANAPVAPVRYVPSVEDRRARERAEREAAEVVRCAVFDMHPYLARKGFPTERGLVDGNGRLVVPMRSATRYEQLQSVQWIADDGAKKFMPGGAAKGAVFRIGSGSDLWLCEGYATGLSMAAALKTLYWPATVVVCFSAGNLVHVAGLLAGRRFVMADHDVSATGERAARETSLPWVMPPTVGDDANDMHQREGVRALAALMGGAR